MAAEEFFMYLTLALIVLIPVSVRVHRYLTRNRVARMLREQGGGESAGKQHDEPPR